MNKLYQWIFSSLRTKMLTMFIILTSIPLATVGWVAYQKSYNTITDYSKAATMIVADQLARDIDVLFLDTGKLFELENNPAVVRFLFSQTDSYSDAKDILMTFDSYRDTYTYEGILNISMVNLYGRGISERRGVFALQQNPLRNPHFKHLMNRPDDILIIPPTEANPLDRLDGFQYDEGTVVSMIATVKQRITREVIGYIVIDVAEEAISQFTNSTSIAKTGYFYIADPYGTPIVAPSQPEDNPVLTADRLAPLLHQLKGSFVHQGTGKPQFVVYTTSAQTGWKIVGVVPVQEIVRDAHDIRQLIIVSVGLSILFIVGLYFFITARLTRPIQILKRKMRQAASGYLEGKVYPKGQDEVADLGSSYNRMIEQIKLLIQQSVLKQKQIQKAELRTLQAQINPHFLYNTLDSIVWMAEAGKNKQVVQLVQAMSRFFRISLSKGRDWITVKEEIEHVRNYLVIQQTRYRDILDYDIQVDNAITHVPILKMTLQPIVENALYHGLKNQRCKGLIRITGRQVSTHTMIIDIIDDGVGIAPDTLEKLRARMNETQLIADDNGDSGYGLHNVQQRIRLYYGDNYGITLSSEPHEGTHVSIRIPIQRGESA